MMNEDSSRFSAPRESSGNVGRPSVEIPEMQLKMLHELKYTVPQMAVHFGCSQQLVYKRLYAVGLKQRDRYTQMAEEELDRDIPELQKDYPHAGSVMMEGLLDAKGVQVQRKRLRQSMSRVNPLRVAERLSKTVSRRKYSVQMSNSLWHIDGHMKLIRWGITHGGIDGHSRLVTFLACGTNNKASTVLKHFIKGCEQCGIPSRVCSDHGGENIMVALFMNFMHGSDRHSHITDRSVHNQRIERSWKDVHEQVTSKYYHTFYELEDTGLLDPENEDHKYVLHAVFIPRINKCLELFKSGWNSHRVSTEKNKTPQQLWLDGILGKMNTLSQPIKSLFTGTVDRQFLDKLSAHGVDVSSVPDEVVDGGELLSPEVIDRMLTLAAANSTGPVTQYKECLNFLQVERLPDNTEQQ